MKRVERVEIETVDLSGHVEKAFPPDEHRDEEIDMSGFTEAQLPVVEATIEVPPPPDDPALN